MSEDNDPGDEEFDFSGDDEGQGEEEFLSDGGEAGLITEADLYQMGILPVPEWARRPPQPKEQPTLFD